MPLTKLAIYEPLDTAPHGNCQFCGLRRDLSYIETFGYGQWLCDECLREPAVSAGDSGIRRER